MNVWMKPCRRIFAILCLTGCCSFATGSEKKPNILYILTDQWRATATGYAGDPNVKTPNLDVLAKEGIRFDTAVSVLPVCTPYRASLLTGRYPTSTGMFMNDLYLPSEELCMAEIYKEAGYDTGYIGKWHLDGHGRDQFIPKERRQGFDYWKVQECTHDYTKSFYYANEDQTRRQWEGYDAYAQTKDAQAYIREHAAGEHPFLLVVAFGGPHFPHAKAPVDMKALYPPSSIQLAPNVPAEKEEEARIESQGYYAHCTALDQCVGELRATLREAGVDENTILVFTSDHGEMMGAHGQPAKTKQRPWDESIRVPFLIRYPAVSATTGRIVKTPMNTPDILPTLLGLSRIAIPKTMEGEDLSRFVRSPIPDEDRAALFMNVSPFADNFGSSAYRGLRTARYTYVRSVEGPWVLYDNETDPYQLKNLIADPEYAPLRASLDDRLSAQLKAIGDDFQASEHYIEKWGYKTVGAKQIIPVSGKPQGPSLNAGRDH